VVEAYIGLLVIVVLFVAAVCAGLLAKEYHEAGKGDEDEG